MAESTPIARFDRRELILEFIGRENASFDEYHQLYDLIAERIAELQAAGKPVPKPLGFQEREAFHAEWLAEQKNP